jgi:hypothetical protein
MPSNAKQQPKWATYIRIRKKGHCVSVSRWFESAVAGRLHLPRLKNVSKYQNITSAVSHTKHPFPSTLWNNLCNTR